MIRTLKSVARRAHLRRSTIAAVRMCCERNALAWANTPKGRPVGRILCYHSVGQPAWGVNDVPPAKFRRQLELCLEAGYEFVPASEIVRTGGKPKQLAVTFDDGLKSVGRIAAPILASYGIPWSIFVVANWSDGKSQWEPDTILDWRELERVASSGAEIGSHSMTHPDFGRLDPAEYTDELGESRLTIERRLGITPKSFAIPFGQSMNWTEGAARIAREVGYDVVYAQAEHTRPAGTVARTFVTRFDGDRIFKALLGGAFDRWEEWV
jgi:peptidoglycan/xylan/chitin deacetylase (PgdA/CDA1 family)